MTSLFHGPLYITVCLLRINVLAKGYSGISLKTLKQLIDAFNCSCLSWVPEQGTVGASGAYGIPYHTVQLFFYFMRIRIW